MSDPLKLPAKLDLAAAQTLVNDLSKQDFSQEIALDASAVEHLGALCVQTILSASRAVQDAGGSFTITGLTERVEEQLACMGLNKTMLMEGAR